MDLTMSVKWVFSDDFHRYSDDFQWGEKEYKRFEDRGNVIKQSS